MSSLKEKGIEAFIWDFFGKILIYGSSFIVTIVLARLLTPTDFGIIAIIMAIIGIASILFDIGLAGALIQRKRVLDIHYTSVFYFNLTVGILLTLLMYIFAHSIAEFFNNSALESYLESISIIFTLIAFHTVQTVTLKRDLNYKQLTKLNFMASFSSGILGVGLAIFGFGIWSLILQVICREVIYNLVIWRISLWKPTLTFSFKALKQLWNYGFHIFLAQLLTTVYQKLDYMFIAKLFPAATLGYFYQAKQLNNLAITYFSSSLMSVLFPLLSKIQYDTVRFQAVVINILSIVSIVTFFILGELYLISDEFIILLLGNQWGASIYYFKLFLLSAFTYPISALMVDVLKSRGKSKKFLRLEIYKTIIMFSNLYVLYAFGIELFLYSLIFTRVIATLLNIKIAVGEIKLSMMCIVKPIVIEMILTVVVVLFVSYLVSVLSNYFMVLMLAKGLLFLILYILSHWLLKIESFEYMKEEYKNYREKRRVS
jgi:O-antigen/teichoic acid export membrane protein